jgi:hypothetical protein
LPAARHVRNRLSGLRDTTKKKHQELRDLKELRRHERICSEQAKVATMDLERDGLLAKDCGMAAQVIEAAR